MDHLSNRWRVLATISRASPFTNVVSGAAGFPPCRRRRWLTRRSQRFPRHAAIPPRGEPDAGFRCVRRRYVQVSTLPSLTREVPTFSSLALAS
jgi:hypothetical protein